MTIHEAYQQLSLQLCELYDTSEAANISDIVIEFVTGQKKIDRMANKLLLLSNYQQEKLAELTKKLLVHKPVQYVLGEAWFAGLKFYVDENVLIPRPETEELVEWIKKEVVSCQLTDSSIIDIGTGSGCIAIALKKKLPATIVSAIDVSEKALEVAKKNAAALNAEIDFLKSDFLNEADWDGLSFFDVIVSNPPYVKQSEGADMAKHVLEYEPHIALFVPDDDALLFYRKIALFGETHLNKGGMIFMEINETLGTAICELFETEGYTAILQKDLQGKHRMVKAIFTA